MSTISKKPLSDADLKQIQTRNSYRRALQAIMDTVCDAQTDYLEPKVCDNAGIVRASLALDELSEDRPFFFNRFQGTLEDFSDPDPKTAYIAEYMPGIEMHDNVRSVHHLIDSYVHEHEPTEAGGSYGSSWDYIGCGDLFETKFRWEASSVALATTNPEFWPRPQKGPNPPLPHVKCIIENWVFGDDRLLRGEIKAIIQIMGGRLHAKSVRPHLTAPVMLYSTMGPWHVRILEAYFDGRKLVVRNTPLWDLRDKNEAVLENLCRWWHGNGIGNTKQLFTNKTA